MYELQDTCLESARAHELLLPLHQPCSLPLSVELLLAAEAGLAHAPCHCVSQ